MTYNITGNPRQPEDMPTASETPTYPRTPHIAKFTANIIMGTTPLNHYKEVIYNIKGNPRQPEDTPTASETPTYPPTGTQYM